MPASSRLCFIRLILTLKQAPRMHQNAPLPDKKFSGEGARPPPKPSPTREEDTPSPNPAPLGDFGASILDSTSPPRFSRLRRSAFPFLFIYDSNTAAVELNMSLCQRRNHVIKTSRPSSTVAEKPRDTPYYLGLCQDTVVYIVFVHFVLNFLIV